MVKVHHLQYKLSRQSKKNSCVFLLDACCVKHTVCQWQKNLKTLVVSNIATFLVQDEGDRHLKHPPNPFSLGPWLFVGSTNLNILHIGKGVISQTVWLHCGHTLLEQFWTHSCGRDISIRLTLSSSLDTSFLVKLSVESSHPLNCATRMVSSWVLIVLCIGFYGQFMHLSWLAVSAEWRACVKMLFCANQTYLSLFGQYTWMLPFFWLSGWVPVEEAYFSSLFATF